MKETRYNLLIGSLPDDYLLNPIFLHIRICPYTADKIAKKHKGFDSTRYSMQDSPIAFIIALQILWALNHIIRNCLRNASNRQRVLYRAFGSSSTWIKPTRQAHPELV